jgi:hypothetical protein
MMLQENGEAESSAGKAFTCVLTYFDSQSLTLDHQVFNVSGNPSTSLQELQLANFLHNLVSAD